MSRTYAEIMASYAEATTPKSVDQATRDKVSEFTGINLPEQNSLYDNMLNGIPLPEPEELPNNMDLPDEVEIKRQNLIKKYQDYDISEFNKLNLPPEEVAKHFTEYANKRKAEMQEQEYAAMAQEHAITDKALGGHGFTDAVTDTAKDVSIGLLNTGKTAIDLGSQGLNYVGNSFIDGIGWMAGATQEEIVQAKNAFHNSGRMDVNASKYLDATTNNIVDTKSDYTKRDKYLYQKAQQEDAIVAKEQAKRTTNWLNSVGIDFISPEFVEQMINAGDTVANLINHSSVAAEVIGQSLPSIAVSAGAGAIARGAATANATKGLGEVAAKEFLASQAGKQALSKVSSQAALATIGLLEGTSNASEALDTINNTKDDDLQNVFPEYKALREQGYSEQAAKAEVVQVPYLQTLGSSGFGAMLISKLTGTDKLEGNLFTKQSKLPSGMAKAAAATGSSVKAMGKEAIEEGLQEGLGQYATNLAEKSTTDPTKNIHEGVGEAFGTGAVAGIGTTAVMKSPNLALDAAKFTAKTAQVGGKLGATAVTYGLGKAFGKAADVTADYKQNEQVREFEAAMDAAKETPITEHANATVPPYESGKLDEVAVTPEAKATYQAISTEKDAPSSIVSRLYTASMDASKTPAERKDLSLMAYQMLEDMEAYKGAFNEALADGTATPEIIAEARSVIGAYDAVLNTDVAKNIRNTVQGFGLTSDEIDTLSQPLYDDIHDGKITPETYKRLTPILQQARINSSVIPDKMVSTLAQMGDKLGLTKPQQSQFRILDNLRKSSDAVSQDILTGSDDGKFVGLDQHQRRIISALERGKPEQAKERLDYLGSFAKRMETKAEAFKEAAAKMDPKDEPAQVTNPQTGKPYVQLDGETPSFVHPVRSAKLIDQIAADAKAVRDTHTELSKLFEPEEQTTKTEPVKEQEQTQAEPKAEEQVMPESTEQTLDDDVREQQEEQLAKEETVSKEEEILNELREEQITEDARKHEESLKDESDREPVSRLPKGNPNTEATAMITNLVQRTGKPKNTAKMSEADIEFSSTNQVAKWYKPSSITSAFNTIKDVTQQLIDAAKEATPLLKAKDILGSTVDMDNHTVAEMKTFEEFGKFRDVFSRMYKASIKNNLPKDGENIYWNEARTLYFMEQTKDDKGNVTYAPSQRFIDSLAVAAYQWLGDVAPRHYINDARAMMDILGLDNKTNPNADQATALQDLGTDRQNVVDDLSRAAITVLGIHADKNAPYNVVNGIEKAIALDIIQTLHNLGLVETTSLTNADLYKIATGEVITKQSAEWTPTMGNTRVFIHPVKEIVEQVTPKYSAANDLFNTVFSPTKEKAGFSLEPITYSNEGIHRNRYQSAPEPAVAARNKASSQEHHVNVGLADIAFNALGEPVIKQVLGIQDESNLNVNTFASVDGSNRTIRLMIEGWHKGVAKVEAAGKSLSEAKAYFKYNFGPQLRMNLDSNDWNPQSNKLVRELVTVPSSTYNLNNEARRTFHTLAQAQGLGIDIDKQSVETSKAEYAKEIATTYRPAIDLLKQAIEGNELTQDDKQVIVEAADKGGEAFRSLHSLVDQARLELAQEDGSKDFTTHTYIEIDGITNGPFNAITQLGLTDASQETIDLLKKGGFFFGEDGMIYNNYREDTVGFQDLYETTASRGNSSMAEMLAYADKLVKVPRPDKAQKQAINSANAIRAVSAFIKGIEVSVNDDGSTTFTLGRKFIKNPVTVTVYSGSIKAINRKIAKGIEEVFYNHLSEAIQGISDARTNNDKQKAIEAALEVRNQVQAMNIILRAGGATRPVTRLDSKSINKSYIQALTNFTFTPNESAAILKTVSDGIGVYTAHAIDSQFGPVREKASAMVAATSIMNVLFNRAYTQAVEEETQRKRNAGELSKYESLSQKEMDDIFRKLSVIAPIFNSPLTAGNMEPVKLNRGIMLNSPIDVTDTGSSRTGVTSLAATRNSGGKKIKTDTSTIAFESPGVKAMPFLVQSMEAAMQIIQRTLSDSNSFNVFDALMSSVNNMEEASANINKGVAFSWAKYNLLEDFTARFKQAMERQSLDNIQLTKEEIKELVFSLGLVADGALVDRKAKTVDLPVVVEQLTNLLESYTEEVQAIREALFNSGISSSIDQMTGTGLPHSLKFGKTKTDITDDMTPAEKLEATHKAIKESRNNEKQAQRRRTAIADNFTALVQKNPTAQSMTLNQENTMNLVRDTIVANPTPTNRLLGRLLGSLSKTLPKDLALVVGNRASVEEKFIKNYPEQSKMIKDSKGLIADNTIYIPEPSLETLTHELLHAGTRDVIFQYFSEERRNLSSRQKVAVDNIHKLMNEFLTTELEGTEVNEIKQLLTAALSSDSPAIAVSEFVAWGLSNPHLSHELQHIRTKGNYITNMVRKLYKLVASIFAPYSHTPAMDSIYAQLMGNVYSLGSTKKVNNPQMLYQKFTNTVNQLRPAQVFSNMKDTKISRTHSRNLEQMLQSIDTDIKQYIVDKGHSLEGTHTFEDTLILEMIDPTIRKSTEKLEAHGWSFSPKERYAHQYIQAVLDVSINDFNFKTNEVERLYNIAKDKLSADSFLSNPETANQYEKDIAQQKYDAVFSGGAGVDKGNYKTTRLTNFLALAESSEEFRKVLNDTTSVRDVAEARDFDSKVKQATSKLVSALAGVASKTPVRGTIGERLGFLNRELAHFTAEAKKSLLDGIHDAMDTVEGQLASYIDPKRDNIGEAITRNAAKIKGKRIPAVTGWGAMLAASAISDQSAEDVRKAIGYLANNLAGKRLGAFASFVHEDMGTHEDNIALHKLKDKTVAAQERAREQIRTQTPKVIRARFKNLTEARTEAIQRGVLDTDMTALLDNGYTLEQINELLSDNTKMKEELSTIEQRLAKHKYGTFYVNQANGLGRFMVNGVSPLSRQLFNAKAISNLATFNKQAEANANAIAKDVDTLASLVALDNSSLTTKQELSSLLKEEAEGVKFTAEYHKLLKQDEQGKLSADGSMATVKGYSATINNPNKRITLAPATERAKLEAMGYTMGSRVTRSSNDIDQTPIYLYYSDEGGNPRYVSGALSTVRTSISGMYTGSGRVINGTNTIHYRSPKDVVSIMKRSKQADDAMFNSYVNMNQQNYMQPVLDADGSIIAYAYKLPNAVRDTRLESSQDFAERLGVWEGRIFEEQEAQKLNQELVKLLADIYHKDMRELKQNEYTELDPKSDDPRIREVYSLMPEETKALFKKAFPDGKIKVRKDLFDNAFGYRQATLQEALIDSPENQAVWMQLVRTAMTAILGDKAYIRVAKADRIWKEVVSNIKDWILIRSVVVNVANYTSNVIHLLNKGMTLKEIAADFGQGVQATEAYRKLSNEIFELERIERMAKTEPEKQKIRNKIGALKDSLARNPMVPLIEAGFFPSIQEKAEVNDFSYKARALDKLYQLTDKIPMNDKMRTISKNVLITQDSAVYDFMNKSTKYGDFLAKYALYNHLVTKGKKSHEATLAQIMDEFVNYNMIPSRTRDFLESMGVTWFLNYKIRIQKIILRSLRENPVRTLLVMNGMGLPNIYEANAVTGNFSYNIGIGNVTNGITAHPLWGMGGDLIKFIR